MVVLYIINRYLVTFFKGHAQNVSAVSFHPELPILLTGSEDGTVRFWHAGTYRLEYSLNYGFERVWAISSQHGSNNVAIGSVLYFNMAVEFVIVYIVSGTEIIK